ncbi:MAG: PHP domain-containing protein [Firmicutes bacterium]|nr:PHP domain-containing protein [Bacillota bacterium]
MRQLKADFHCHVKIMGHGSFRPGQLKSRLEWARRFGLDLLAITEHIDIPDFWDITAFLEDLCDQRRGVLRWRELVVITGAEVNIAEGGHILLIGGSAALRQLEARLGRLDANNPPLLKELLDASENLGFLRIGAHPCRRRQDLWKMGPLLKRLDALEINGRELSTAGWVTRQAGMLNIPVVTGSDAHHWLQMGRVYNLLPLDGDPGVAAIKDVVANHGVTWRVTGGLSHCKSLLKGAVTI